MPNHDPEILTLDEPDNGLDPNGIQDMIKLIKNLRVEGKQYVPVLIIQRC